VLTLVAIGGNTCAGPAAAGTTAGAEAVAAAAGGGLDTAGGTEDGVPPATAVGTGGTLEAALEADPAAWANICGAPNSGADWGPDAVVAVVGDTACSPDNGATPKGNEDGALIDGDTPDDRLEEGMAARPESPLPIPPPEESGELVGGVIGNGGIIGLDAVPLPPAEVVGGWVSNSPAFNASLVRSDSLSARSSALG